MITGYDVIKLSEIFATKQDLERVEEKMATKEDLNIVMNGIDKVLGELKTIRIEQVGIKLLMTE